MLRDYTVLPASGGYVAGRRVAIGSTVRLLDVEADYEIDAGNVLLVGDAAPDPQPLLQPTDTLVVRRGAAEFRIRLADLVAYLGDADPDPGTTGGDGATLDFTSVENSAHLPG